MRARWMIVAMLASGCASAQQAAEDVAGQVSDQLDLGRGRSLCRERARFRLEAAAHLQRLQESIALGNDRERQVHRPRADRAFEIGAAALADLDHP